MFELTVESEFCAAHAIRLSALGGELEPLHGHNFRVRVTYQARELDRDGLVVDFHAVERALERVLERWNNRNLNDSADFRGRTPSAEHIAQTLGEQMQDRFGGARLKSVAVTEAPRCWVEYFPPERGGEESARP